MNDKTTKDILSFKPKAVPRLLLSILPERAQDIVKKRFGLDAAEKMTLDAIGKQYGITRERVRQIEDFSLRSIRRSSEFAASATVLTELKDALQNYGGVAHEQEFLKYLDNNAIHQNCIHFLLVLGSEFTKLKESDDFHHRWTVDESLANQIEDSLRQVCQTLAVDDLLSEEEMVSRLLKTRGQDPADEKDATKAKRWLAISKRLGLNPVGEWGLQNSPNVRARGVRDYAFLVLRKHGSPMHFSEVAKEITNSFGRRANPATCHNELIKDKRFVLVGRGIYALAEWGYRPGIVLDVIKSILKEHGPLSEEEVIAKVLKERYVKPGTIIVNLKNPKHFKRDKEGRYQAGGV